MTDWAELYRSVYPELVRFLQKQVWDPERAADLAQEAFVRGLRHNPRRPRAWLFQVSANLARDEARAAVRRKKHLTLLKGEMEISRTSVPDPASILEGKERASRVRTALDQLTQRDREALLLWNSGSTYNEIAEHTGLASGAVGTTLARARKRFAEAYQGLESGEDSKFGKRLR